MVEQRTKEIGIRKVFGANERNLRLISKDFLMLVPIGIIIAVPVAYYFMSNWLEELCLQDKYRSITTCMRQPAYYLITFMTISYKAYQASIMNPASSIKTE